MPWFTPILIFLVLAFEFVNGFHDTAHAAATVIYTHSLKPTRAVIWSAFWNFLGVFTGLSVAVSIMKVIPTAILASNPTAMACFFLGMFVIAIAWNLGTWYLGLPASSSHTLTGALLGAGFGFSVFVFYHQPTWASESLLQMGPTGGVNWNKAKDILIALLISPAIGFMGSYGLFNVLKRMALHPKIFEEPKGHPPPLWIRSLLITTSAGVSFAHGSNDGQKGIGLMMLVLIATSKPFGFTPEASAAIIPWWVIATIAITLGVGTTVGWKRIVVTLGEKIGKTGHLTYAQGMAAELMAALTISLSSHFGVPVSTTHVLSSGIAGTMVANEVPLQIHTVKNILSAWVLTLPVTFVGSSIVVYVFLKFFAS